MLKGRRRAQGTHETSVRYAKVHANYDKGKHTATQMSFEHNKRWHVVRLDEDSSAYLRQRGVIPHGTKDEEVWY